MPAKLMSDVSSPQAMPEHVRSITLIRHGRTSYNARHCFQGQIDIPLDEIGEWQVRQTAQALRSLYVESHPERRQLVVASDLSRAMATAHAFADPLGLVVHPDARVRERNFGEWEGHTIAELKEKYGKAYIDFFENPFDHPVPGEGSFQNAMDRALEGFAALAERHKGQNVAIVSHGGLLRVMLVGLLGMGDEFYRKTWMTNTSVTMVDVMEDGRKLLMTLNDKAHLEMAELFEKGEEK